MYNRIFISIKWLHWSQKEDTRIVIVQSKQKPSLLEQKMSGNDMKEATKRKKKWMDPNALLWLKKH